MTSAMKAYSVLEEDENTGGITFARTKRAALRDGASRWHSGEPEYCRAERAPWADEFASTGGIPAKIMIANGWNFECCGCGARLDEDFLLEQGLPVSGVIGVQDGAIYCCARCKWRDLKYHRAKEQQERIAIAAIRDFLLERFPDAEILGGARARAIRGARGGWHWDHVSIPFAFPGMAIGHATCELRPEHRGPLPAKPTFRCCAGDRAAFEAWALADHLALAQEDEKK